MMDKWQALHRRFFYSPKTKLMLDWEGLGISDEFIAENESLLAKAFAGMDALESGAIANPDEGRMVGHYWLRAPELAPNGEISAEIADCLKAVTAFTKKVQEGEILSERGEKFKSVIVAGIGGSSLGPVFVYQALAARHAKLKLYFLDNTDPDGMDAVFEALEDEADTALTVVISKSGGTIETRNCMEEARAFYEAHGLSFAKHTVCISGRDSKLDKVAQSEGWLERFPMWDFVGGRTSVMAAVGLLPLALAGVDTDALLRGAADCDALTRCHDLTANPAAIMALGWYACSGGRGGETMVVLPYKNSLELFAKYLQQLIMESLGKEFDLDGNTVHQGLAVMGNKGSSDQHSYVQQLVAGPDNVFVTFVQVLRGRAGESITVGEESTSGDYLHAFMLGTKKALEDHGKRTMTLTIPEVNAYQIGQLIALFERAVGLYAQMVHINAYDQPAVEWGKKAAGSLIALKNSARAYLAANAGKAFTAEEVAAALGAAAEDVFRLLLTLDANDDAITMSAAQNLLDSSFSYNG